MIRPYILGLIALWCGLAVGSPASAAQVNDPVVTVEFTVAMGEGAAPLGAFISTKEGVELPLQLNNSTRSPVYTTSGPFPLLIWGRPSSAAPKVPVAAVSIAPGSRRVLIVLMPAPKAQLAQSSHVGLAVEDAWETNPAGSLRFFNFTGRKVAAQMQGQVLELGGGASKPFVVATQVKPPAQSEPVLLRLAQQDETDYRMFYDGKVSATAQERLIALLIPSQVEGGLCRMRILREALPKPLKAASLPR